MCKRALPSGEVVLCDLLRNLRPAFDLLLFNPPYVPSSAQELSSPDLILRACSGGVRGRQVLDRLLFQLNHVMHQTKCVVFLLALEENRPDEIAAALKALRFECCVAGERKAHNERIVIIMAYRGVDVT